MSSFNDKRNKLRERTLVLIAQEKCSEFYADPQHGKQWTALASAFQHALTEIAKLEGINEPQKIEVIPKGGRKFNYDFLARFVCAEGNKDVPVEFKFGGKSISTLPEFFNPAADKPFHNELYAAFFYKNYLSRIAAIYELTTPLPREEEYMRAIHKNEATIPFLKAFDEAERADTDKSQGSKYKQKQRLVAESISAYLNASLDSTRFHIITEELKRSQQKKRFLIYSNGHFYHDAVAEDEMELEESAYVKNGNVLVCFTKSGKTEIHMLLRWKNHLGVLFPAWQISMIRNNS